MEKRLEEYRNSLPGKPAHFAYYGEHADFERYRYIGVGQHRDSDTLERSNFAVILKAFEDAFPEDDEADEPAYLVERSSNWLVGWSEGIRIDTSNPEALALALGWHEDLESYPVADEEHHSRLESEEREEHWIGWARADLLSEMEEYDELVTLLNLDEDGDADGFRDEDAEELARQAFEDAAMEGEPDVERTIDQLLGAIEEYREERRAARRAAFEEYQLTLQEV